MIELDRASQELIEGELAPGERIVCATRPIARWLELPSFAVLLFGCVWTGSLMHSLLATIDRGEAFTTRGGVRVPTFGTWILLPFLAIGVYLLTTPYWSRRAMQRTAYAVTDRRALVVRRKAFGGRSILSFDPGRLTSMERVERRDGSGDLVFEVIRTRSGSSTSTERRGFLSVADVRGVEAMLRDTLLRGRVRDA